jgi:ppGpp synthetase/RelA/SpoT-type nucleotidyltranferase
MLWQNQDLEQHPALEDSGRDLPTTFGETFQAAWSRNNLFGQRFFGENDRLDALGDYLNTIKQKTGVDIYPQLDVALPSGDPVSATMQFQQANEKLAEMKKQNPALDIEPMTLDQLEENAAAKRRQADADFEATMDRPRGPGATLGRIAGGIAAGAADPVNIAALPLAPEAGLSLIANAMRWGEIGAGTQAVATALQAPFEERVHPGYMASGAPLLEVAEAGVFGGVAGGLWHGAANVAQRFITGAWPQSVKDAGHVVNSQANIVNSNVYPGAAGTAAHEQALPKAIDDALRGHPVDVSKYITPEQETARDASLAGLEPARRQAQDAVAAAERPAEPTPAPELPFERTAAEAKADEVKLEYYEGVGELARQAGYDMPAEERAIVGDRLIQGTPEEAEKLIRDLQMSPRQVADAPARLEAPPEPVPTPVTPVEDPAAPDFQGAVRADLDRETAKVEAAGRPLAEIDKGPSPERLPETHELYFKLDADTHTVPIEDLISSKSPEENIKGSVNGAKRMAASAAGELGKRAPITVRPLPGGKYLVLDGNGTMTAAKNYGWRSLPVHFEISERGMPSLAARAGETGGLSMISRSEAPPGVQPPEPQPSILGPAADLTSRYAPPSIYPVSRTVRFSDFKVGDIDPASNRKILQASNDLNALMAAAEENKPHVEAWLNEQVAAVPGMKVHGLRVKDLPGIQAKIAAKGRAVNTISDFLGTRVVADTPNALYAFVDRVRATGGAVDAEEFLAIPKIGGYRAVHLQIGLGDGTSVELQVVPKPMDESMEIAHAIRQPVKRILDDKNAAPADLERALAEMKKADAIATDAWQKAPEWSGGPTGQVASLPSPIPNGVATFAPNELGVDPERFQFKAGGDEAGVTDRLKDVKTWDPIKAGMSLVWVDNAGKPWIIDGHQRLGLAQRIAAEDPAQKPQILARTLREDEGVTPAMARTTAALKNIAEGTGTAVDAAKVIRDNPERIGELPPRSELVRQARGLVNLSDEAFRMVVNDVVPANYAAIVGRLVPGEPELQGALLRLLSKVDPANTVQAEAVVRQGIEAGTAKAEAGAQASLFGDQDVAESLYLERAKVLDRALKTLRRDKTVFGTLVKEAETLETAGNVLAKDINEQRATADGTALQIIQTLANRAGPISTALRTAAGRAKSDGYATATREFVETVRQAVSSGELTRLANGLERGATHVGDETTAGIIDRGLAAEPGQPDRIADADERIKDIIEKKDEATAAAKELYAVHHDRAEAALQAAEEPRLRPAQHQEMRQAVIRSGGRGLARYAQSQGISDDQVRQFIDYAFAAKRYRDQTFNEYQAAKGTYEPGAEGKPQAIMPGMEPSAVQLAAARAGPMRGRVPQEEPGELFSPAPEKIPDMFMDASGHPVDLKTAMSEIDGMKLAADQLASCAAPAPEAV